MFRWLSREDDEEVQNDQRILLQDGENARGGDRDDVKQGSGEPAPPRMAVKTYRRFGAEPKVMVPLARSSL